MPGIGFPGSRAGSSAERLRSKTPRTAEPLAMQGGADDAGSSPYGGEFRRVDRASLAGIFKADHADEFSVDENRHDGLALGANALDSVADLALGGLFPVEADALSGPHVNAGFWGCASTNRARGWVA